MVRQNIPDITHAPLGSYINAAEIIMMPS